MQAYVIIFLVWKLPSHRRVFNIRGKHSGLRVFIIFIFLLYLLQLYCVSYIIGRSYINSHSYALFQFSGSLEEKALALHVIVDPCGLVRNLVRRSWTSINIYLMNWSEEEQMQQAWTSVAMLMESSKNSSRQCAEGRKASTTQSNWTLTPSSAIYKLNHFWQNA